MLVQDPLSKYPRLGKYALIFSIIPGYFHEYDAEEVIQPVSYTHLTLPTTERV